MKIILCLPVMLLLSGCQSLGSDGRGTFQATPGAILYGAGSIVECKYNVGCYSVPQP